MCWRGEVSSNAMMDTSERVRRKVWPEALKREIVAAASAPGASVSVVARQYDMNTKLVFTWRRLYGKGRRYRRRRRSFCRSWSRRISWLRRRQGRPPT
jgi:transposase-like protein